MSRRLCLVVALSLNLAGLGAADDEAEKLKHTTFGPYFEKNTSGLKADKDGNSYLVIRDKTAFDRAFGVPRVMKKKPVEVPKGYFDKHVVLAVIKRGSQVNTYEVDKVTLDGNEVRFAYRAKAQGKPGGAARFASPLIVGMPKVKFMSVEFVENDKTVKTVAVGKK
jgi:hypothetical protein